MAGVSVGKTSKKKLEFELNLVPFIDILATCICFLLMTTVWIHLKGVGVRQSVGTDSPSDKKDPASIQAMFSPTNGLVFSLKNVKNKPTNLDGIGFNAGSAGYDWERVEQYLAAVKAEIPGLEMGMVIPKATSKYEDIVQVMGLLKKQKFNEVGISPY